MLRERTRMFARECKCQSVRIRHVQLRIVRAQEMHLISIGLDHKADEGRQPLGQGVPLATPALG